MNRRISDRAKNNIQRPKHKIEKSGDIILIVCEGTKTEPDYFLSLRNEWKISPAQIKVLDKKSGWTPLKLVKEAKKCKEEIEQQKGYTIDEVWCVFDHEGCNKDKHFEEAVNQAKDNQIRIAPSFPCFEIWFLLHFIYTTKPFNNCDAVVKDLKEYLNGYEKSKDYFLVLYPLATIALKHAGQLRKYNEDADLISSATDVDLLVKKMQEMKRA